MREVRGRMVRTVTKDMPQLSHHPLVIPAQAGIQCTASAVRKRPLAGKTAHCWIPACAGMTLWVELDLPKPSP